MFFDFEADLCVFRMDLIIRYLRDGLLPDDKGEAHGFKVQLAQYWLSPDQKLY